jgi:hypothetical protein
MPLIIPGRSFERPPGSALRRLWPGHGYGWSLPNEVGLDGVTLTKNGTINRVGSEIGIVADLPSGTTNYYSYAAPYGTYVLENEGSISFWLQRAAHTPAADNETGLANAAPSASTHYPYTDGNIYMGLLKNDRPNIGTGRVQRTEWHHLAVTSSVAANAYNVYQNGQNIYSSGVTAWAFDTLWIGRNSAGHGFYGRMGDVMLWSRALTPGEVWALYNQPTRWSHYWQPSRRVWVQLGGGGTIHDAAVTETADAQDSPSAGVSVGSAVTESAKAQETVSAAAELGASVTESAKATDTTATGSIHDASIAESAVAADAVAATVQAGAAVTETAVGVDSRQARLDAAAAAAESAKAVDLASAQADLVSAVTEQALALDQPSAGGIVDAAVTETAKGVDTSGFRAPWAWSDIVEAHNVELAVASAEDVSLDFADQTNIGMFVPHATDIRIVG